MMCEQCEELICKVCGHEACPVCEDDCDHPDCFDFEKEGNPTDHICMFDPCPAGCVRGRKDPDEEQESAQ
jgi:hypothetical protein